jgi:hypothetical protein
MPKEGSIEALDLIINVLREHEKDLNNQITGLDRIVERFNKTPPSPTGSVLIAKCKQWNEFRSLAKAAEIVFFLCDNQQNTFRTDILYNGIILTYCGDIPKHIAFQSLKKWISTELNVSESRIIEGTLETK